MSILGNNKLWLKMCWSETSCLYSTIFLTLGWKVSLKSPALSFLSALEKLPLYLTRCTQLPREDDLFIPLLSFWVHVIPLGRRKAWKKLWCLVNTEATSLTLSHSTQEGGHSMKKGETRNSPVSRKRSARSSLSDITPQQPWKSKVERQHILELMT